MITSCKRVNVFIIIEKIENDRSHDLEGTIFRVFKGSQKLNNNDLVNKVLTQFENFKIQIIEDINIQSHLIKNKIDKLIEREIIARDRIDIHYFI